MLDKQGDQSTERLGSRAVRQQEASRVISLLALKFSYRLGQVSLHAPLFSVHIALIALLYAYHLERHISIPLGKPENVASLVIVVASQTINQVRRHQLQHTLLYLA